MDITLKSLIEGYGRACRRDGNPAWESDEGIALGAYLTKSAMTPVATVDASTHEVALSTTAAQRVRLVAMHGAPLFAGPAAVASTESHVQAAPLTASGATAADIASLPETQKTSESELHFVRRSRDSWCDEAGSLARRLVLCEADNDLLRKNTAGNVWTFQGDEGDNLDSMGNDMAVLIHAGDLRTLLAEARFASTWAVPPEVSAWRDAYQHFLEAGDTYNAQLSIIDKTRSEDSVDIAAEEAELLAKQATAHAALKAMYEMLSSVVSTRSAADGGAAAVQSLVAIDG